LTGGGGMKEWLSLGGDHEGVEWNADVGWQRKGRRGGDCSVELLLDLVEGVMYTERWIERVEVADGGRRGGGGEG